MEFDPSKIEIQNEAGIFAPLLAIPAAIGRAVIGGVARAVGGDTIIGPPPLAIARSVAKKIKDRLGSEDDEKESLNASHESLASSLIASRQAKREEVKAVREDEEAIAARDEFLKVMDMKPKGGLKDIPKAIDTIKQIVADKQNMQVKFDDGKMKVDLYTASAVSAVYDALKPETQEKVDNMLRTKEGMLKLSNFAFSKLNEEIQMVNEAEKEGRLDEERLDELVFLPYLAALGTGALRTVGAAALRKYGPKLAQKYLKPGVKGGTEKLLTKGAGTWPNLKTAASQILKKTPYKTATALTGVDAIGPGGLGTDLLNVGKNLKKLTQPSNNNSSNTSTSNRSSGSSLGYSHGILTQSKYKDGKPITELGTTEYTGVDGVPDKDGKYHDPNSPKGKMIINMKKKNSNPNPKDKDGDGKDDKTGKPLLSPAELKKYGKSILPKGGLKKVGKKVGKVLGKVADEIGFGNPLKASKYSPEDKAIEMMTKATEQAMNEKVEEDVKLFSNPFGVTLNRGSGHGGPDPKGVKLSGGVPIEPKLMMPKIDKVKKSKVTVTGPEDEKGSTLNYDDRVQRLARIKDTKVDKKDDKRPWNKPQVNF